MSKAARAFEQFLVSSCADSHCPTVEFRLSIDPELPSEGFSAQVGEQKICLAAGSARGIVQGLHYLRREIADARGPWLCKVTTERFPSLKTALTEGIFVPVEQTPEDPGEFSDSELELMVHFGATGLKIVLDLSTLWESSALPEINARGVEARLARLESHARRLGEFGLDLFLLINLPSFHADHEVFRKHPEIRGAIEEIFLAELAGQGRCVLCPSQPLVKQAIFEVAGKLSAGVPSAAGWVVLVGGEGFRHCHTRPLVSAKGGTNCPRCGSIDPHACVADLLNNLFRALRAHNDGGRLLAWPYSAFVWSKDDSGESRWIRSLDQGIEVLSNFDCGEPEPGSREGVMLFDYNLRIPGPSSRFQAQLETCRDSGRVILAKTETTTTPDSCFLPFLPLPFRWYERFRAIREAGAGGFMGQWRFYGMNGSLPEEIQYHSIWNPGRTVEEILMTAAQRDYSLSSQEAGRVVDAWGIMDQAWDWFPYSAMTGGERDAYFRGPWFLGPAHPLIMDPSDHSGLGPGFFQRRGDLGESLSREEIARLGGRPRFSVDCFFCLPYGVAEYEHRVSQAARFWDDGLLLMEEVLARSDSTRAREDLNVCRMFGCHLRSLANVVSFMRIRDTLYHEAINLEKLEKTIEDIQSILQDEIGNARKAREIVSMDPRPGFGFTYGPVYDAEMIDEKLRHCERMRDVELPRLASLLRFHVWYRFP